jgi:pimeloyl-ACP methyl ester carboxylesterase
VILHRSVEVDGATVFYRESGPADAPAILLLHGFPASSFQFVKLMEDLGPRFRCVAPDLPGFGYTETPPSGEFHYTFQRLGEVVEGFLEKVDLDRFALYAFDFGAAVGFRVACAHPQWVSELIVQNGNLYEQGLSERFLALRGFWSDRDAYEDRVAGLLAAAAVSAQYTEGARDPAAIAPDPATLDQHFISQPGRKKALLDLLHDYQANIELYPSWQAWLRENQPRTLVVWGRNDPFFTPAGAEAYRGDAPDAEIHLLDTGHFALQEDAAAISEHIQRFLTPVV